MQRGPIAFAALLMAYVFVGCVFGNEPKVLLSSKVATDGDFLTLPVEMDGKRYSFMVDTGSPYTVFDKYLENSLTVVDESEPPAEVRRGQWSKRYHTSPMTILGTEMGRLPFPRDAEVRCINLAEARDVSDQQIDGVLGMDVLEQYALQLDLNAGWLRLLDSESFSVGRHDGFLKIDMVRHKPCVQVQSGLTEYWALIDTGAAISLHLQPEAHQRLLERQQFTPWVIDVTIGGASLPKRSEQGWLKELKVGPFRHNYLAVSTARTISLLGIDYWKRYFVTFDFPRKLVYMDKGPLYDMFDESGHSGIYVDSEDEDFRIKVVTHLVKGCLVEQSEVQVGDRLISINGKSVAELSVHSIYRRLATRHVSECLLCLERNGKQFTVTLPKVGPIPYRNGY